MDHLIVDALRDLLVGQCTPAAVRAIEAEVAAQPGQASASGAALWQQIEDTGFADLLLPESAGGAGLVLRDAFAMWDLLGQHAMPLPLAETMLARAWLAAAGAKVPAGAIALAPHLLAADGGAQAAGVRGAHVADWVLAQAQRVAVPASLLVAQAGLVSALLAGALLTTFEKTLNFANERQQFGRPIGKFQAIQHELAVMAEHVSAARMAAQIACEANGMQADALKVAVGKARTSEAAVEVASLAHSIHGAIGFTTEFDLQLFTRRLHLWRQTANSEAYWQLQAGQALVAAGGMGLDVIRQITDPVGA